MIAEKYFFKIFVRVFFISQSRSLIFNVTESLIFRRIVWPMHRTTKKRILSKKRHAFVKKIKSHKT